MLFVQEVLGADPDDWQAKVLTAYGLGTRKISLRSCHGSGKTVVMSWCAIHHILCRYPQRTVCTAPTSPQLFDALAAEMKSWITRLPGPIRDLLEVKVDHIDLKADPNGSFIAFRTSRAETPEAIQGIHSEYVLLLLDEASAIPEAVFEAGIGSMSGKHAVTILGSNPTRSSGLFYDSQTRLADDWLTLHISADVPEASPGAFKSARVDPAFVADVASRYGRDSNAFRVRVLGEFPRADLDTFIAFELVDGARKRDLRPSPTAERVWGVDCARFGDDNSTMAKRHGNVLEEVQARNGMDTMQVAGWVVHEFEQTPPAARPTQIMVDSIGIGAGVVDRLRELGLPAQGVNTGELPALHGDRYLNLRAELWGKVKAWLASREVKLPDDEKLAAELVSVRYGFTSSGKLQMESKEAMRKQKRGSPDRADALCLTFAAQAATAAHGWGPTSPWNQPVKRSLKGVY